MFTPFFIFLFILFQVVSTYGMTLDPKHIVVRSYMPFEKERRISSYPFITGDTFRALCNHIVDETQIPFYPEKVQKGDTIFVNGNLLERFFEQIYPLISVPFVLVSHNSTRMVPEKLARYLDDEKILLWCTRNPDRNDHPKLCGIPLGIGNRYFPFGNIDIVQKVMHEPKVERKHLLYVSFNPRTHGKERWPVHRALKHKRFCFFREKRVPYEQYLRDLRISKFVISPRGCGLDCYRHWEALLMGAIPIIKHSTLDPLFDGLPVVLVDEWTEVTEQFLHVQYDKIQSTRYDMKKIYIEYWQSILDQYKNSI